LSIEERAMIKAQLSIVSRGRFSIRRLAEEKIVEPDLKPLHAKIGVLI
jgi:hypothetical protein